MQRGLRYASLLAMCVALQYPHLAHATTDTLVVNLSEDAYLGDAQFRIGVDGKAVATGTVTALHKSGETQNVTITGDFGVGAHAITVDFLNDAYGGSPEKDRNLYVNSITFDGVTEVLNAVEYSNGIYWHYISAGPDTLVLNLSEDAYEGNAQFTVSVDGKQISDAQQVTALHSAGASQNFTFKGNFAVGKHTIGVAFLNDAWGGTPETDRNLYVNSITMDGTVTPINKKEAITEVVNYTATVAPSVSLVPNQPPLYVYKGAGCTGLASLPLFENFIGRPVDGIVDFIDYTSTWANAASAAGWGAWCWSGHVKNVAFAMPLSVASYTPVKGSTQFKDIANGVLDKYFTEIGSNLVGNGFPNADIRLGWEENGGWYPWAAYKDEAGFKAAFAHVYKLLKAIPGSNFTVWFNPTIGWESSQQSTDFPGATNMDGLAWDVYANAWLSGGQFLEPALWNNELKDAWGVDSVGTWESSLPTAIPEWGVGSSSDGHGAPDMSKPVGSQANGGDDPYFMTQFIGYIDNLVAKGHPVAFTSYWDFNGGGYNSMISNASRPQEAIAFLQAFAPPVIGSFLNTATYTATPVATVTGGSGMYSISVDRTDGTQAILIWSSKTIAQSLTITLPAAKTLTLINANGSTTALGHGTTFTYPYTSGLTVIQIAN